jgi:transcription antitermination factor NusG
MTRRWYALRTKPNKEALVWQQAQVRGFKVFYPRLRVHPVNPRARKVVPYFPGYLFVEADLQQAGLSTFQYMPYTLGLVCFGGEPAYIPESFIHEMKRRMLDIKDSDGLFVDHLNRGDRVLIQDGPFSGYEAIFDTRLSGNDRVRVLLNMLSDRHILVEMGAGMISKVRG